MHGRSSTSSRFHFIELTIALPLLQQSTAAENDSKWGSLGSEDICVSSVILLVKSKSCMFPGALNDPKVSVHVLSSFRVDRAAFSTQVTSRRRTRCSLGPLSVAPTGPCMQAIAEPLCSKPRPFEKEQMQTLYPTLWYWRRNVVNH